MEFTVFSCGILYERFAPGGLQSYGMGEGGFVENQGDYLVDVGMGTADVVEKDSRGQSVHLCMTSVEDVVRFVVAAIELGPGTWPREFKMRGERLTVRELVRTCESIRGGNIVPPAHYTCPRV